MASVARHYLQQCWHMNRKHGNNSHWNFNQNKIILIQENLFENVVHFHQDLWCWAPIWYTTNNWDIEAGWHIYILSQPQCQVIMMAAYGLVLNQWKQCHINYIVLTRMSCYHLARPDSLQPVDFFVIGRLSSDSIMMGVWLTALLPSQPPAAAAPSAEW